MNQNLPAQSKDVIFPGFKGWIYLCLICSFLFTSCARYYYAPNSVNIPLLDEKEAKINAQYLAGGLSDGVECQSAFAITSHFGGMVNMMVNGGNDEDLFYETEAKTNMSFIEIGGGYFTPIKSTALIFETYAGVGTGGVRNDYDPGNSTVRFTKLFIQPNIGVKNKYIEFGISSRMSWTKHRVMTPAPQESSYFYELDDIKNNPVSIFWEPGVVLRAGGNKFKVQLQYTASVNLSHPEDALTQEEGYFAFGFTIPIHYTTTAQ